MTRTLVNGKWVNDQPKDYSNGKQPLQVDPNQSATIAKLHEQLNHMHTLVKAIDQCTRIADAKQHIRVARASYPR